MRNKINLLCVLILFAGAMTPLAGQRLSDEQLHEMILKGIDFTMKQEYPEAQEIFRSIISSHPRHPSGYLYLAATLQAEYSDFEAGIDRKLFDSLLVTGQLLAEHMINSGEDSVRGFYYVGTAQAYRAFSESDDGKIYSAIMDGVNSAKMFEQCLSLDSSFYDAMAGLGTYYYWRSRKTEFLSWLPFISDRKNEGIQLLTTAMNRGTYDRFVAENALMWIYIDERRLDDALKIIEKALASYPENRSFLWGLLSTTERQGDSVAIKSCVGRLLASIMRAPVRNVYGEITCRLKLAQFALASGNYESAAHECGLILAYKNEEGKTRRDIGKKLDAANALRSQAGVHLSQQ